MTETKSIAIVNKQISAELKDPAIIKALLTTTFKGLSEPNMRQAIFEGMLRGFTFKDFLEKNVYAIPYSTGYSLVTSIDHARKIGMKSGVIGKGAPVYEFNEKKVVSCSITIKRRFGQDIGEYTATVFFDEYNTGKNLWSAKPMTMIAKVAEMHALRMACPEEMSQLYTQDELEKREDEEYDTSEIEDDANIEVHVGSSEVEKTPNLILEQHPVEEKEIPETEAEQKNLILALVAGKWSKTDLKDAKEVKGLIADYTELEYTPANYPSIIKKLR